METSLPKPRNVTAEELEYFREHGWTTIRGLIHRDSAAAMLARARKVLLAEREADGGGEPFAREMYFARDNFPQLALSSDAGRLAQTVMDRPVAVRYFSDLLLCRLPEHRGHTGTQWHQDYTSYPTDRWGSLHVWIALNELTPEHGTMRFLDGSQREGPLGRYDHRSGDTVVGEYPHLLERYAQSAPLSLAPGDATIHHSGVVHSSPANLTSDARWSSLLSYFPADARYSGVANPLCDGLGLSLWEPLADPSFPVVFG